MPNRVSCLVLVLLAALAAACDGPSGVFGGPSGPFGGNVNGFIESGDESY